MKQIILLLLTVYSFFPSAAQLKYDEIIDLTTICKKQDFESAQKFLIMKGYSIESFEINYDHGSYVVLCNIKAKSSNTNFLVNNITVNFDEYNDYKKLSISQSLITDKEYKLTLHKAQPFWSWANENWTTVLVSKNSNNSEQCLGQRTYFFDFADTSLKKIEQEKIRNLFKVEDFQNNKEGYNCFLVNTNPNLDNIKYNVITYQATSSIYSYSLTMWTKFLKGRNIISQSPKILEIPLIRNGDVYSLFLKFGSLTKKYILDSGASDMSIDNQTYEHLDSLNLIKIENRLSDSKYQLADGSMIQLKRIIVPKFLINEVEFRNIKCTIISNGRPLLLGKSFLDSFKSWKINNEKQTLTLELF